MDDGKAICNDLHLSTITMGEKSHLRLSIPFHTFIYRELRTVFGPQTALLLVRCQRRRTTLDGLFELVAIKCRQALKSFGAVAHKYENVGDGPYTMLCEELVGYTRWKQMSSKPLAHSLLIPGRAVAGIAAFFLNG